MYIRGKIEKKCLICEKSFSVFNCEKNKKYCSRSCKDKAHIGHPGHWLGKKRDLEMVERMRANLKGRQAWNKGLIGFLAGPNHHRRGTDMSGQKNGRWVVDRSKLVSRGLRNDSAYQAWRLEIYKRDNYKCKINNCDCSGRIEAHHILSYTNYPELRFNINNGITLCRAHHPRKRAEEKRLIPEFQKLVSVSSLII